MICFKYYGRIFILGEETRWARNWRETADVGRFERVEKVSKKEPKQYRGGLTPRWAPAGTAVEGGGAGRAFRRWGGAGAAAAQVRRAASAGRAKVTGSLTCLCRVLLLTPLCHIDREMYS